MEEFFFLLMLFCLTAGITQCCIDAGNTDQTAYVKECENQQFFAVHNSHGQYWCIDPKNKTIVSKFEHKDEVK